MPPEFVRLHRLPRSEPPITGSHAPRLAARTGPPAVLPAASEDIPDAGSRRAGSTVSAPRRGPHSGRSGRPRAATRIATDIERVSAARHVADRTLRLALEVIDRRRPAASLRSVVAPAVVGMIGSLSTTAVPGRSLGAAVVRTVHVRAVSDTSNDVEVFGTYTRGDRVFAVAGRLTARRGTAAPAWMLTGLRLS